ncbi:hypothetical protein DPMN_135229 [Dreissena polymorpha]|uniref:Uncharacterized protein n=1 Tax=Dreissena polymorpha TaxID=45954 RepID=A0A9D4JCM8_DREPO|nr:hypothetical protein DPMN_135229 [Dreissena polymorpha]
MMADSEDEDDSGGKPGVQKQDEPEKSGSSSFFSSCEDKGPPSNLDGEDGGHEPKGDEPEGDELDEICVEEMEDSLPMEGTATKSRKSKSQIVERVAWTTDEIEEINELFKKYLVKNPKKKCPRQTECLYAISCKEPKEGHCGNETGKPSRKKSIT